MSRFEERGPRVPTVKPTRVDKVHPRALSLRRLIAFISIVVAIIMLLPVLVMGISAFKTHVDVMSSPPKVLFKPSLEGFMLLFTDRAQVNETRTKELLELQKQGKLSRMSQLALDAGMEITGPLPVRCALGELGDHRGDFHGRLGDPRAFRRLRIQQVQSARQRRPDVLHPEHPHAARGRCDHTSVPHVPPARAARHASGNDHPVHGFQPVLLRVAAEGFHRRDPQGIRGGGARRRLYAYAGVLQDRRAPGGERHRGNHGLLPDLRVERVRIRPDAHQRARAHGAAEHCDDAWTRGYRMVGHRGRSWAS